MWHCLILCVYCLKSKIYGYFLMACLFTLIDTCANSIVFSIPKWFICNFSSSLFCRNISIMILLLFIASLSKMKISSLNDQYGCAFFVLLIHGISLSLFILWLCLDSQSTINSLDLACTGSLC